MAISYDRWYFLDKYPTLAAAVGGVVVFAVMIAISKPPTTE